jgi:hypothetical protein
MDAATQPSPHIIHYSVDDEPQETTEHALTPIQIMQRAGIDPSTHYLVELVGNARKSYKDAPSEPIHMHEHQKFATQFTGEVPVS